MPTLSPDEKRVAIGRNDAQTGTYDIWLLDLARAFLRASHLTRQATYIQSGRPTAATSSSGQAEI